jgi:hypothetical protein
VVVSPGDVPVPPTTRMQERSGTGENISNPNGIPHFYVANGVSNPNLTSDVARFCGQDAQDFGDSMPLSSFLDIRGQADFADCRPLVVSDWQDMHGCDYMPLSSFLDGVANPIMTTELQSDVACEVRFCGHDAQDFGDSMPLSSFLDDFRPISFENSQRLDTPSLVDLADCQPVVGGYTSLSSFLDGTTESVNIANVQLADSRDAAILCGHGEENCSYMSLSSFLDADITGSDVPNSEKQECVGDGSFGLTRSLTIKRTFIHLEHDISTDSVRYPRRHSSPGSIVGDMASLNGQETKAVPKVPRPLEETSRCNDDQRSSFSSLSSFSIDCDDLDFSGSFSSDVQGISAVAKTTESLEIDAETISGMSPDKFADTLGVWAIAKRWGCDLKA